MVTTSAWCVCHETEIIHVLTSRCRVSRNQFTRWNYVKLTQKSFSLILKDSKLEWCTNLNDIYFIDTFTSYHISLLGFSLKKSSPKNFTCPLGEQRPDWKIYKLIFLTPTKTWFHNHHSNQTIFVFTLDSLSTFTVLVTLTNSKGGTNQWRIKFFSKNSNDGRCILVDKLLTLLKQVKIYFTQLHITRQKTMMKNLKAKQDIPPDFTRQLPVLCMQNSHNWIAKTIKNNTSNI